jgi:uncharacterized repeat protein (TIGR04052 family)
MRRLISTLVTAALAACATPEPERAVEIAFALTDGSVPVSCGSVLADLGTTRVKAHLSDARFYVQDVALLRSDGQTVPLRLAESPWQHAGVALLDFEDGTGPCRGSPATNLRVVGTVPDGAYTGLSFVVGVPPQLNHTSPAATAAPLDSVAMGWSWQAGRKFIKIELDPEGGVARVGKPVSTWYLHLGSTGCAGDPVKGEPVTCTNPNRIPVKLPAFDPARQPVVLDLRSLFADSDLSRDGGGAPGCMSGVDDPDCPGVFTRLGLDRTTGQPAGRHPFTIAVRP